MSKRKSARARAVDLEFEPLNTSTIMKNFEQEEQQHARSVVQPTKFFGEPGEDIEKWLKSFDRVAKANNWNSRRQCDILPAYLRDRAAEFYDELSPDDQGELDKLKQELSQHFMPREARRFYYADLYSRKQNPTETAADFGRDVQQLVRRAYAEMPVEHQDTLMREHFVNGLRPELKRMVLISDPKSFNKALELAKREEINDKITNGYNPWMKTEYANAIYSSAPVPVAKISSEPKQDRLERLENVVEKLALTMADLQISGAARRNFGAPRDRNLRCTDGRPICNFCKKLGHTEAQCRTKQYRQNQGMQNVQSRQPSQDQRVAGQNQESKN